MGLRVVEAVGEEVAHVEDDLAAAADDPREADAGPGVDEGVGHRARLGDARRRRPRGSHGLTSPMYVALLVV